VDLDHVALATTDVAPALDTLVGVLGGLVLSGGQSQGFRPMQVRVGDATRGMTVELLEPWDIDQHDFLARFLARHGDGPHHLTVKVDDFDAALDAARATGRTPVGVNRADPNWREAFLVPAEACGTVVQLAAQADTTPFATRFANAETDGPLAGPAWWPTPPPRAAVAAELCRVVLRTPDRAAAGASSATCSAVARRRAAPAPPSWCGPAAGGSASRTTTGRRGSTASSWPARRPSAASPGRGWSAPEDQRARLRRRAGRWWETSSPAPNPRNAGIAITKNTGSVT
jgi:catechol 2,3-dioxygenase-like lactoylglutathione lyase family enzyme